MQIHADQTLAVPGNCDLPETVECLRRMGIGLHGGSVVLDGLTFVGVGGSLPCPGRTPHELSESELGDALQRGVTRAVADGPRVLVSHQPPYDTTADLASNGMHVGSRSVRAFIEEHEPLICFTGHIHEGVGIDTIGPTKIVNPGLLRHGAYAFAEVDRSGIRTLEIRGR